MPPCTETKDWVYTFKRGDFDIANFPFLDGDVPRRPSYGVYIYLNLFALPEHLHMLLTPINVTNS